MQHACNSGFDLDDLWRVCPSRRDDADWRTSVRYTVGVHH
jgi:hypothetical protein